MEPSLKRHQEHVWASSPECMGTSTSLMPLGESRETPPFPEQGGKASAEARVSRCSQGQKHQHLIGSPLRAQSLAAVKPAEALRAGPGNQRLSPSKRQLKKERKKKQPQQLLTKYKSRSIWGPGDKGRRET